MIQVKIQVSIPGTGREAHHQRIFSAPTASRAVSELFQDARASIDSMAVPQADGTSQDARRGAGEVTS